MKLRLTPAEIRKTLTALLGFATIAVTQGLITGTAAKWVAVIVAGATTAGVYIVKNRPPSPSVTETPPPSA